MKKAILGFIMLVTPLAQAGEWVQAGSLTLGSKSECTETRDQVLGMARKELPFRAGECQKHGEWPFFKYTVHFQLQLRDYAKVGDWHWLHSADDYFWRSSCRKDLSKMNRLGNERVNFQWECRKGHRRYHLEAKVNVLK